MAVDPRAKSFFPFLVAQFISPRGARLHSLPDRSHAQLDRVLGGFDQTGLDRLADDLFPLQIQRDDYETSPLSQIVEKFSLSRGWLIAKRPKIPLPVRL